ncbi:hypothetical protein HYW46_01685 [Candidatus Daviesbacteria bacterium]|nr:hypothetical protein [Candidatus Daviesbacteria bacterium]
MNTEQAELILKLLKTKTRAPVRRREIYIDDDTKEQTAGFTKIVRDTHPIDFPVHWGEFVLKKHEKDPFAPLSPYYINLRNLPQDLVSDIASQLTKLKFSKTPDCIAGIPNGVVPFAKKYSEITGIPYEDFLTKEALDGQRSIVSYGQPLNRSKNLLLFEDVLNEGTSSREAIRVSEYLGYQIIGIGAFFEREQGGLQYLQDLGFEIHAVMSLTPTMDFCRQIGRITQETYDEIINYKNLESSYKRNSL